MNENRYFRMICNCVTSKQRGKHTYILTDSARLVYGVRPPEHKTL